MAVELGTVGHGASVLAEPFHRTLETFTFGNSGYIHLISGSKDIRFNLILYGIILCILKAKLSYKFLVGHACLVKMALHRFCYQLFPLVNKADLYGLVAVVLLSLHLGHYTGTSLQNRHRNQDSLLIEDLGHSDLCS